MRRPDTEKEDCPPRFSEDKCAELTLLVPGPQCVALEREAHRLGLTLAQLVRHLIAAHLV